MNAGKQGDEPGPLTAQAIISILIVFFSVFLDFMGVSLVQPILPFYAEEFGATPTQLGALYSSYSGMSLLASLFMGKFSDRFGRKPMICFSLFGTCVGFLACGLAQNYGQLLAFRFLTGIFGSSISVALAVITDLVPAPSRPKYLATQGAVVSLAFIMGPGIGSGLAQFNIQVPFFASSGLGAFGFLVSIVALRESHPTVLKQRALKQQKQSDLNEHLKNTENAPITGDDRNAAEQDDKDLEDMDQIKVVRETDDADGENGDGDKIPVQVWILCAVNTLTSLGFTAYTSMLALYLIEVFALDSLSVGYVTLCWASMSVIGNVTFIVLSSRMSTYKFLLFGTLIECVASLVLPFLTNLWAALSVVVIVVGAAAGVITPASSALHASFTTPRNRGTILSLSSVAQNLAFIIGPLLHGTVYGIDTGLPFFVGGACLFLAFCLVVMMLCKWPTLRSVPHQTDSTQSLSVGMYVADTVKRRDYMKLGKALGVMLSERKYNWVTYMPRVIDYLNVVLPPLSDAPEVRTEEVKFLETQAYQGYEAFRHGFAASVAVQH
mmetsp:Transcript_26889/g.44060  ORF Transcript_26889/g.44060 Transcript_26889/m.44060 type:complete len:551 (-) Transcript_26889:90-1742(-)